MVSFWWSGPSNPILQWPWVPGRRKCNERAPQIYHKWFGLPTSDPDITPRILSQVPPELVTWLVISQSGTNISSFGRFLLLTECFLYMSSPSMFSPHFKEILVPDWLITSHVTYITSSDWLLTSSPQENRELLRELSYYSSYALASYGWPMFMYLHPFTGWFNLCQECR